MVFDELGNTLRGMLGGDSNEESQNPVDEEFNEMYNDDISHALENQNYGRAEELVSHAEQDFDKVLEDYIEHKFTSASAAFEYFEDRVDKTEEVVRKAANEVRKVQKKDRRIEGEKLTAKPSVSLARSLVEQMNSDNATEAMRTTFKAFYQAGMAADYASKSEDIELEEYNPEKVKLVSGRKASDLRDLDEKMGIGFMTGEYERIAKAYDNL